MSNTLRSTVERTTTTNISMFSSSIGGDSNGLSLYYWRILEKIIALQTIMPTACSDLAGWNVN